MKKLRMEGEPHVWWLGGWFKVWENCLETLLCFACVFVLALDSAYPFHKITIGFPSSGLTLV